ALPAGSSATTWVAPLPTAGAEPYHLVVGPDGSVWFTELQGNRIGRVAPGGAITEYALPDPGSKPHGPAVATDGNVWVAESGSDRIARITPLGVINEFPLSHGAGPAHVVQGADGNIWITESGRHRIGRMSLSGEVLDEFPIPTRQSNLNGIAATPDGGI